MVVDAYEEKLDKIEKLLFVEQQMVIYMREKLLTFYDKMDGKDKEKELAADRASSSELETRYSVMHDGNRFLYMESL